MSSAHGIPRLVALLGAVLLALTAIGPATGIAAATPPTRAVIADQYVVTLAPVAHGSEAALAAQLAREHQLATLRVYQNALQGFAARMTAEQASVLAADPRVAAVEPDQSLHIDPHSVVAARNDAVAAASSGRGVHVYVVDTGVDVDAPELAGRVSLGVDVVGTPVTGVDCSTHGTAIASVIAGAHVGVAPEADVVAIRALDCGGAGSTSSLLGAIDWVTANAVKPAVVSVSATVGASDVLDTAIRRSIATGLTYANAAGDGNTDACAVSPARVVEGMTVAAADATRTRAATSNFGSCVDLFASGVDTAFSVARVAGASARYLTQHPAAKPVDVAAAIVGHAVDGVVRDPGTGTPNRLLSTAFLDDGGTTTTPSTSAPSTTVPNTTVPNTTVPTTTSSRPPSTVAPPVAGPTSQATVQSGSGVNVFIRGTDGGLWWRQLTAAGWSAWQAFGGQITGAPSAAAAADGSVYVFARGADGAVWWQGYNGTRWSGWLSLGGYVTTDPVAVADGAGVSVFARGGDNAMYWQRAAPGWSGWRSAGGVLSSKPAAVFDGSLVMVVVRASDGSTWVQGFANGSPSGWGPLGGFASADPTAARDSTGVSVFVRGGDNALYRRLLVGGTWLDWQYLGGVLASSPAAVGDGSGVNVFARGTDNAIYWQRIASGVPQGWGGMGGVAIGDPAAAADISGVTVFTRGADNLIYAQRYSNGWPGWGQLSGVPAGSSPFALAAREITAGPQGSGFGQGFDTCEAPSTSAMATWRLASPYTSIGIYIGGINRACSNNALNSASWVNTVSAQGWKLLPIYVGLQAPCGDPGNGAQMGTDLGTADALGTAAASDAASRAGIAGIGPGAPIYFDMEGYNNTITGCVAAVRQFINAWVGQLHALGYRAGMYSSLCSGIVDQATIYDNPLYRRLDAVWVAAWAYAVQTDPRYDTYRPSLFGYTGCGAALTDSMWPFHQRIRQFRGGHTETYGSVTINIDTDAVDGPVWP